MNACGRWKRLSLAPVALRRTHSRRDKGLDARTVIKSTEPANEEGERAPGEGKGLRPHGFCSLAGRRTHSDIPDMTQPPPLGGEACGVTGEALPHRFAVVLNQSSIDDQVNAGIQVVICFTKLQNKCPASIRRLEVAGTSDSEKISHRGSTLFLGTMRTARSGRIRTMVRESKGTRQSWSFPTLIIISFTSPSSSNDPHRTRCAPDT